MSLGTARERENLYEFAADFLKARNSKTVLDVACDDGSGTVILANGFSGRITGLDINASVVAFANSHYSTSSTTFVEGDARHMNFADMEFDAIVSFHTIEHMSGADQSLFVKEMVRILRPGGWLLIAAPDGEVWKLQGIANMQEGHIKEPSRKELEEVLKENGFVVKEAYGQWPLKKGEEFTVRRILNFLKRLDVFRLRRLLGKKVVDGLDQKTQPVVLDARVMPLGPNDKASVNVFVCKKS